MSVNKIYAVVISFNPDLALLDAECNSIILQVDTIIYVDNYSKNRLEIKDWSDSNLEFASKEKVKFIWLTDNEGIGAAQNAGIRQALAEGASHVILFDQDTVVADDFVKSLLDAEKTALKDGINVGLTGPIYQSYDNFAYPVWSVDNDRIMKIPQEKICDYRQVTHIIASGSLIRKEVFEQAGLMREDWFLGYIDFEFCFRAAEYGFKTIVTNKACMRHQMGDSQIVVLGRKIGLYSPFRRYFDCRNTLLIQRCKVLPKVLRRYYLMLVFGKVAVSLVYGPLRLKQIRYCLRGFYDGMKGISGKCTV